MVNYACKFPRNLKKVGNGNRNITKKKSYKQFRKELTLLS